MRRDFSQAWFDVDKFLFIRRLWIFKYFYKMGRKCCVPRCRSNYTGYAKYTTSFGFPKDKERRDLWIRSINRAYFTPSATSVVCINHFEEKYIIREDRVRRDDGSLLVVQRKKITLTCDAYPTIFQKQPSYPTKTLRKHGKYFTERPKKRIARDEEDFQQRMKELAERKELDSGESANSGLEASGSGQGANVALEQPGAMQDANIAQEVSGVSQDSNIDQKLSGGLQHTNIVQEAFGVAQGPSVDQTVSGVVQGLNVDQNVSSVLQNPGVAIEVSSSVPYSKQTTVKPKKPAKDLVTIRGRRIIDVAFFLKTLKDLNKHSKSECDLNDMVIVREQRAGLVSCFYMKCTVCKFQSLLWSEDPEDESQDINAETVAGMFTISGGFWDLRELLTKLRIPMMTKSLFAKEYKKISQKSESNLAKESKTAGVTDKEKTIQPMEIDGLLVKDQIEISRKGNAKEFDGPFETPLPPREVEVVVNKDKNVESDITQLNGITIKQEIEIDTDDEILTHESGAEASGITEHEMEMEKEISVFQCKVKPEKVENVQRSYCALDAEYGRIAVVQESSRGEVERENFQSEFQPGRVTAVQEPSTVAQDAQCKFKSGEMTAVKVPSAAVRADFQRQFKSSGISDVQRPPKIMHEGSFLHVVKSSDITAVQNPPVTIYDKDFQFESKPDVTTSVPGTAAALSLSQSSVHSGGTLVGQGPSKSIHEGSFQHLVKSSNFTAVQKLPTKTYGKGYQFESKPGATVSIPGTGETVNLFHSSVNSDGISAVQGPSKIIPKESFQPVVSSDFTAVQKPPTTTYVEVFQFGSKPGSTASVPGTTSAGSLFQSSVDSAVLGPSKIMHEGGFRCVGKSSDITSIQKLPTTANVKGFHLGSIPGVTAPVPGTTAAIGQESVSQRIIGIAPVQGTPTAVQEENAASQHQGESYRRMLATSFPRLSPSKTDASKFFTLPGGAPKGVTDSSPPSPVMDRPSLLPKRLRHRCNFCCISFSKQESLENHLKMYCKKLIKAPPSATVTSETAIIPDQTPTHSLTNGMTHQEPSTGTAMSIERAYSAMASRNCALKAALNAAQEAHHIINRHKTVQQMKVKAFTELDDVLSRDNALLPHASSLERRWVKELKIRALARAESAYMEEKWAAASVQQALQKQNNSVLIALEETTTEQNAFVAAMKAYREEASNSTPSLLANRSDTISPLQTPRGFELEAAFSDGKVPLTNPKMTAVQTQACIVTASTFSLAGSYKDFTENRNENSVASSSGILPETLSLDSLNRRGIMYLTNSDESRRTLIPEPLQERLSVDSQHLTEVLDLSSNSFYKNTTKSRCSNQQGESTMDFQIAEPDDENVQESTNSGTKLKKKSLNSPQPQNAIDVTEHRMDIAHVPLSSTPTRSPQRPDQILDSNTDTFY